MSKKLKNENQGITLIALIITIIVMLILVSASVSVTINSGLFGKAGEATKEWNEADKNLVEEGTIHIQETVGIATKGAVTTIIATEKSANDYIKNNENITEVVQTKTASKTYEAPIPTGFTVSGLESEQNIENGLVIYQIPEGSTVDWTNEEINMQEEYSQFVWIPVENPNKMIMCQSEGTDTDGSGTVEDDEYMSCNIEIEESTGKAKCTTHNSYNLAGRLYATSTGNKFNKALTTQIYPTDESGLREPAVLSDTTYGDWVSGDETKGIEQLKDVVEIAGTTDEEVKTNWTTKMQTTFNNMAKSVVENKGFYVGRYETSLNGNVAESKSNKTTMNAVNWYSMYKNQQTIGEASENLGVVSHMMWGSEYDQVMMFVDGKLDGNNVAFNVKVSNSRGSRDYSILTGQQAVDKVANIYDLEGSRVEWTQEAIDTVVRATRGNACLYYSPASNCAGSFPYDGYERCSSRLALYIE